MNKSSLQILVALGVSVVLAVALFTVQGGSLFQGQVNTLERTAPGMTGGSQGGSNVIAPIGGTPRDNFIEPINIPVDTSTTNNVVTPVDLGTPPDQFIQPLSGTPTGTTNVTTGFDQVMGYCCYNVVDAYDPMNANSCRAPVTAPTCCRGQINTTRTVDPTNPNNTINVFECDDDNAVFIPEEVDDPATPENEAADACTLECPVPSTLPLPLPPGPLPPSPPLPGLRYCCPTDEPVVGGVRQCVAQNNSPDCRFDFPASLRAQCDYVCPTLPPPPEYVYCCDRANNLICQSPVPRSSCNTTEYYEDEGTCRLSCDSPEDYVYCCDKANNLTCQSPVPRSSCNTTEYYEDQGTCQMSCDSTPNQEYCCNPTTGNPVEYEGTPPTQCQNDQRCLGLDELSCGNACRTPYCCSATQGWVHLLPGVSRPADCSSDQSETYGQNCERTGTNTYVYKQVYCADDGMCKKEDASVIAGMARESWYCGAMYYLDYFNFFGTADRCRVRGWNSMSLCRTREVGCGGTGTPPTQPPTSPNICQCGSCGTCTAAPSSGECVLTIPQYLLQTLSLGLFGSYVDSPICTNQQAGTFFCVSTIPGGVPIEGSVPLPPTDPRLRGSPAWCIPATTATAYEDCIDGDGSDFYQSSAVCLNPPR